MTPSPDRTRMSPALALPAAAIALLALAGCSTEPEREPPPEQAAPQAVAPPVTQAPARSVEVRPTYRGPWEDPSNPLYNRTIYFDYDSAAIKPEYIGVMRNHAAYLATVPTTRVTLDGNTDERGTREYNLALGDQRAEAVRKFMVAEGTGADQLATLSYGEERPVNPGHNESAWTQNRRVIIQY